MKQLEETKIVNILFFIVSGLAFLTAVILLVADKSHNPLILCSCLGFIVMTKVVLYFFPVRYKKIKNKLHAQVYISPEKIYLNSFLFNLKKSGGRLKSVSMAEDNGFPVIQFKLIYPGGHAFRL